MCMGMKTDVVILGGGLAGLALALQLVRRRPDLAVSVVDAKARPAPERRSTVGESFSEVGSHYLRDVVGLRDHLEARQLPKAGLRFFVGNDSDLGERFELGVLSPSICEMENGRLLGLPLRTHQVDRARLENEMAVRCVAAGIALLEETRVEGVSVDGGGHVVTLSGRESGKLRARWMIFAGGRRTLPGQDLPWRSLGHRTRAAWCRVEGEIDIGDWSRDPAFGSLTLPGFRRLSTNHFMGRGYWTWLIPLPSGVTSVGIVADPLEVDFAPGDFQQLVQWLSERDVRLGAELGALRPVDGDFHVADLEAGVARTCFGAERWGAVGQCAGFVDVLYSPGADLLALGNTLLVDLIVRELEGRRVDGACAVANKIFGGFADGLAEIYRGQYPNFGHAEVIGTKTLWDSALYFGFNTMLFRHGLMGDVRFLSSIRPELLALRALQARVQARFRTGRVRPLIPAGRATVEWGGVDWMMDAYLGALRQPSERAVVEQLRRVLASLEQVSRQLEKAG